MKTRRKPASEEPDILAEALKKIEELEERFEEQVKKIVIQDKKIDQLGEDLANASTQISSLQDQLFQATEELLRTCAVTKSNQERFKEVVIREKRNEESLLWLNQKVLDHIHNERSSNRGVPGIKISKPTFCGNDRDANPIDFLEGLEEYFKVKQILDDEKLILVNACLKHAASNWYSNVRHMVNNYGDFKRLFTEEYWSSDTQLVTWRQCLALEKIANNLSYREHFVTWWCKLRRIDFHKLTEPEIIRMIAYHYPGCVRVQMLTVAEGTVSAVLKLLEEEEQHRLNSIKVKEEALEISTTSQESSMKQTVNDQLEVVSQPEIKEQEDKLVQEIVEQTVKHDKHPKEVLSETTKLQETTAAKISRSALRRLVYKQHCMAKKIARKKAKKIANMDKA